MNVLIRRSGIFAMIIIFSASQALANITAAGMAVPSPQTSLMQVGVVAAVKGSVKISSSGAAGTVVESGKRVYLGDEIATDEKGHLQILLLDETVFTIGPSSTIVIDQFVYDPRNDEGKVEARVVKGVFRFITGKVAHKNPNNMKVKLPVGTMGIRGTIAGGQVSGSRSYVMLLGPGRRNNAGARIGGITIETEVGDKIKKVNIDRTGYGSIIEGPGIPPTSSFRVPPADLARFNNNLTPPGSGSSSGRGPQGPGFSGKPGEDRRPATERAGQDRALANDEAKGKNEQGGFIRRLDKDSRDFIQRAGESLSRVQDGQANFDQLRRIQTGTIHFKQLNVRLIDSARQDRGFYNFRFEIDFGRRLAGTGLSGIVGQLDTAAAGSGSTNFQSFSFAFPNLSFNQGSGPATFHADFDNQATNPQNRIRAFGDVALNNQNGVIAANVAQAFTVNNPFTSSGGGTGITASGSGVSQQQQGAVA